MPVLPLYIVDIIGEVVEKTSEKLLSKLGIPILYEYGRSIQILTVLQERNQMPTGVDPMAKQKYPLFALFQDFPEDIGSGGYYCTVRFPKISIATLTNSTDPAPKRYALTFKPILYPIYYEFLKQCAKHPRIVQTDPGAITARKWDRPGTQPEKGQGGNFNDYIDAIELENLELTFFQNKTC